MSQKILQTEVDKFWSECGFFMQFGPFFYDEHKTRQDKMFILTLMLNILHLNKKKTMQIHLNRQNGD